MKKQLISILSAAGLMLLLSACATKPDFSAPETHPAGQEWTMADVTEELGGDDPIEPFNRSMFAVNDVLMQYLVCPISWVYGSILPEQVIRRIDMASDRVIDIGSPSGTAITMMATESMKTCNTRWKIVTQS